MEILSPVGKKSALEAAVRSGADAVYFGVGDFNARRNAENFSKNDLKDICEYCHIRGVKAYLALNTLISDNEIKEALSIVQYACEASIDALIINDFGLAEIIKKAAPSLPLHASTQMTVHNNDGVKYLKEKGFERVVLAREISLKNLKEISEYANKNNIELEIFVEGAHCMCVSGQCLLSSVLGSRSGNRGLCAQPCRLPFKVKNGSGYDLSLKDMNLYRYFDEFEKLNIASLKIEGRMKTNEYVAAATYSALCFKENRPDKEKSLDTLQKVFSRSGFTDGYLTEKADKSMFGIRSEQDIEKSKQIKNSIHEIYRRERQSVKIKVNAVFKLGEKSSLKVSDGVNSVTVTGDIPEGATSKPSKSEDIINKLKKTGDTPYFVENVDLKLEDNLFISGKTLSKLKESALNKLTALRCKTKPIPFYYKKEQADTNLNPQIKTETFLSVHNLNQLPKDPVSDIAFVPLSSDINKVKQLIENGYNIGIKTPVYYNNLSSERLKEFYDIGVEHALMQNICAFDKLKNQGFIITAAHTINIFNSYSLEYCPADYCTLSAELKDSQIKAINSSKPKGILAYGKLPLMIFRNCPIKANNGCKNCDGVITDRKDIKFKIYCEDGVTKMINNRPIFMADKKDFLNTLDFILLDFTDETAQEVEEIISIYKNNGNFDKPYTRGLYYKGVF